MRVSPLRFPARSSRGGARRGSKAMELCGMREESDIQVRPVRRRVLHRVLPEDPYERTSREAHMEAYRSHGVRRVRGRGMKSLRSRRSPRVGTIVVCLFCTTSTTIASHISRAILSKPDVKVTARHFIIVHRSGVASEEYGILLCRMFSISLPNVRRFLQSLHHELNMYLRSLIIPTCRWLPSGA